MRAPVRVLPEFMRGRQPVLAMVGSGSVAVRDAGGTLRRATAVPADGDDWRGTIGVLGAMLAEARGASRGAQVVLSDRWVRYCVIPAEAGLDRADEQIAFARHAFRGEFGAAVDGWRARVDIDAHGAGVVALIESPLAEAVAAACAEAGLRLDSLAPRFAAVQSRLARSIIGRRGWLAVLDADHATLALRGDAGWSRLVCARLASTGEAAACIEALARAEGLGRPEVAAEIRIDIVVPSAQLGRLRLAEPWQARLWPDPLPTD